jgi:phage terminase large subunit-like protein
LADAVTKQWIRTKADEVAAGEGCYFDADAASRPKRFFESCLRHSKGAFAGKPFILIDWQWRDVIAPLYGWKRPDGTRRFRKAGIWIAKKNGKSGLASAISLYMLLGDGEAGAEVYNAAADRDQASIVFNEAANMVRASEMLSAKLEVINSRKSIAYLAGRSTYRALSADVPTKEGINWHCLIFDELHAQKSRDLWDTLAYGGAARRQPLLISISTAGYDRHSIGYEQYSYAKGVIEGTNLDPAFLAYVAEAQPDDAIDDEKVWHRANPSLGETIQLSDMQEACKEAKASPTKENAFRRYRLNQWTQQDVRWLSIDAWDKCVGDFEPEDLAGRDCFGALDLSTTTDLSSLCLLFPLDPNPDDERARYAALWWFWVPEDAARERGRRDKVPYQHWIKQGLIEATDGESIDYDVIRARVNELGDKYRIIDIGIDRWNAQQIATQLASDGFEVVKFGQGFGSMSAPTKELEALVLSQRILHGGNEVARWMMGNLAVEQDAAGNLKPSKKKSTERIDGMVALVMAIGRAQVAEPSSGLTVEVWG